MLTVTLNDSIGTNLSDLESFISKRDREIFEMPAYYLSYTEEGLLNVGDLSLPLSKVAAEQLCGLTKIPFGWASKTIDHSIFTAVNDGLARSDKELQVIKEDDRIVGLVSNEHIVVPPEMLLESLANIEKIEGLDLQHWRRDDRGVAFRLISPNQTSQPKVGDIVQVGMDLATWENTDKGVYVANVVNRLVCTNGAVSSDKSDFVRMLKSVRNDNPDEQLSTLFYAVEAAKEEIGFTLNSLGKLPEIEFPKGAFSSARARRLLGLSLNQWAMALGTLSEEEETLWGFYNALTRIGRDSSTHTEREAYERAGFTLANNYNDFLQLVGVNEEAGE